MKEYNIMSKNCATARLAISDMLRARGQLAEAAEVMDSDLVLLDYLHELTPILSAAEKEIESVVSTRIYLSRLTRSSACIYLVPMCVDPKIRGRIGDFKRNLSDFVIACSMASTEGSI